ncbi:hypothetical protein J2X47_001959 [Sphingomonas sp. BE270]|uniref:hypothetical protein n=1 Tax=Sphingomonas sp. BE270 TaxID=2817726 RepID=UPI002854C819|nr:hypothetical protein [Sphingomonas sp. BE270]MDR7257779.1 hypothetical protein [Sphingomonas sp. BE270]
MAVSDDEIIRNLKASAMTMGAVSFGLSEFAGLLIAHARDGEPLDDEAIASARATAIRDLENSELLGVPIESEAAFHRKVIEVFENLANNAVRKGLAGE